MTIPVIVRQGDLKAAVALSHPRPCGQRGDGTVLAQPGSSTPAFCVDVQPTGGQSTSGRIRATKPGVSKPLIEARGDAEVAQPTVALPVDPAIFDQLVGPLRIEYLEDGDGSGGTIAGLQAKLP